MKRRPTRNLAKLHPMKRVCAICGKGADEKLSVCISETKDRAGRISANTLYYHEACLESATNVGSRVAITIVNSLKEQQKNEEKRKKFFEKEKMSAAQWFKEEKEKENESRGKKN